MTIGHLNIMINFHTTYNNKNEFLDIITIGSIPLHQHMCQNHFSQLSFETFICHKI